MFRDAYGFVRTVYNVRYLKLALAGAFICACIAFLVIGNRKAPISLTFDTGKWQTRATACYELNAVEVSGCVIDLVSVISESGDIGAGAAVLQQSIARSQDIVGKCHNAAHTIGRAAIARGAQLEQVYTMPFPDCRFGLYHGALEEYVVDMNRSELLEKMPDLCAYFGDASSYATQECVHVLGHFVFNRSGDNIELAVDDCNIFEQDPLKSRCVDGTLMQATDVVRDSVETKADPGRREKIWGGTREEQKATLTNICESITTDTVKYVCYTNAPQTLSVLWDADYPAIHLFCDDASIKEACYQGIAASGFTIYSWNIEDISKACYAGTRVGASACIDSMAFSYSIVSGARASADVCLYVLPEDKTICEQGRDRGLANASTIAQNQIDAREDYAVFENS